MTVVPTEQPEVGRGDLTYSMAISAGELGGTTTVQVTPNHNFGDEVGARLALMIYQYKQYWSKFFSRVVSCNVAHEEHSIYPFHSFNDDELCRDFERKRYLSLKIEFDMLRFKNIFIITNICLVSKLMQYYLNKDWTSFRPNSEKISASQCEHFVSSRLDQARPKGKSKQSHVIFTWSQSMISYQHNQKIVRVIQKLIVLIKVLWWITDIITKKISEISRILFLLSFLDPMVILVFKFRWPGHI